jgi:hypothetical protein
VAASFGLEGSLAPSSITVIECVGVWLATTITFVALFFSKLRLLNTNNTSKMPSRVGATESENTMSMMQGEGAGGAGGRRASTSMTTGAGGAEDARPLLMRKMMNKQKDRLNALQAMQAQKEREQEALEKVAKEIAKVEEEVAQLEWEVIYLRKLGVNPAPESAVPAASSRAAQAETKSFSVGRTHVQPVSSVRPSLAMPPLSVELTSVSSNAVAETDEEKCASVGPASPSISGPSSPTTTSTISGLPKLRALPALGGDKPEAGGE